MAERITSRANPLMAHIRRLASSRSSRYEAGEYLGDGVKLLEEAAHWGAPLTAVVYTPGTALPALPAGVRLVEVPADVMRSVSPMEAPQGALFLARIPDLTPPEALPGKRYLALEGVQDPGNVGTILRTADAFGADGLLLLPGCADLYNHKTVRSSMGAVFRLPAWSCTLEELRDLRPDFISVTYGAGGSGGRSVTAQIAGAIRQRYGIPPLAHLTCVNSTRQEVEESLRQLRRIMQ